MLDVNGTITNWNKGAERIKGYPAEEVIGRHFGIFYMSEARQSGAPARALAQALKAGRFESEGWRVRRDGTRFWALAMIEPIFEDDGRHIGFANVTRDISERRAAEEAILASENQFRLLVSGVVDYALFMLDPNGIVTNWNPGAERIKGYRSDEIVGHHFSRFYTDGDRAAGLPFRALATASDQGRYESEGWRVRKDGSLFWASVVIDAIRDDDGRVLGFAKITRDVTDKRNAQLELQRAHEQLAQAQKMEALGQLTGGVAHDFNNLLMVVSGQAQLLRGKVGDDARALRALEAIEVSTRRGGELTRHLLSFARRQRLQPAAISLQKRIAEMRELLSASLPASVQLVIDLPKRLWPVEVDLGEFELALLNLTVNARDAMPSGGVLSISAENLALGPEDDAQGLRGDFMALTVADSGVGIPPDILPRVFDPFFTTKEVSKGTGLGLSQVYGFAQQSGGEVVVRSELGRGTQFTLYLPRTRRQPSAAERAAGVIEEPTAAADILLVEDNPEVAEVAAGLLEQLGHHVRVVGSAAAAIAEVRQARAPDLVFSDIVMAGEMDGVALAHKLREEAPHIPVLLATGYSQAAERIGGEFPILAKPYELGELGRAISILLASHRNDDERLVRLDLARRERAERRGEVG
jgi:PAS domain S-box-containing protein